MNINELPASALAYLGDAVIELRVRKLLIEKGYSTSAHLNKEALNYVRAGAQAKAMQRIMEMLTEEENVIFHRGRNMKTSNTPKNATIQEYHAATGMETLFGYLYLKNDNNRMDELFCAAYPEGDSYENN